jgi:hypothetical protein
MRSWRATLSDAGPHRCIGHAYVRITGVLNVSLRLIPPSIMNIPGTCAVITINNEKHRRKQDFLMVVAVFDIAEPHDFMSILNVEVDFFASNN